MGNFNLGAFHILYGNTYCIENLLSLVSIKKTIIASTETTISLLTEILNTPSFLGDININIKAPIAEILYTYFIIDNERIPQPLVKGELYGFDLKENENFITINRLLSEKPNLKINFVNSNSYDIDIVIEIYLTKIRLRSK
ncbi:TPA_asm: hypothetical protein ES702_05912 [Lokiarchaeia virus SkuldV3]|uniref:Uncharacterized protein n=1 Tax=Lokiarchaeia virus SkuldV3 TaxID=2983915 RepID=A0A9N7AAV5_9VIRU|nr:hypothetical protein QKT74_gp09 [Lokiarchaeia virus SkuldV3]DAZ90949.1 TPA_asm: hypothetical protein ES702_05912 [Lokiarchaeia virus SkuldV3]